MRIQFKAKVQHVYNIDGTLAYSYIEVPVLHRKHVDMNAARQHKKYGAYANSDLFPAMLAGIRKTQFNGKPLRLDRVPDGVVVDTSGFLAVVSWDE